MFFSLEILPFFMVFANLLWLFIWRKNFYNKISVLLIWSLPVLWLVFTNSLVFENDGYRYFIDGLHYLSGLNPYDTAPIDSPLAPHFPEIFEKVGFPNLKTVYPPFVIWFFAGLVKLASQDFGVFTCLLKLVALFASLAGSLLSCIHLRRGDLSNPFYFAKRAIFLALHPLLVFEWYINLHFDFLAAIGLVGLALSPKLRGVILGYLISLKYVFVVLFPLKPRKLQETLLVTSLSGCVFLLGVWIFPYPLTSLWENLAFFAKTWEMNSGAFRLFRHIGYAVFVNTSVAVSAAYFLYYFLILSLTIFINRTNISIWEKAVWGLSLTILLSPVCNPWYFSWAIFAVARIPKASQTTWFLALSSLPLSYTFFTKSLAKDEAYLLFFNLEHLWIWGVFLISLFLKRRAFLRDHHGKPLST